MRYIVYQKYNSFLPNIARYRSEETKNVKRKQSKKRRRRRKKRYANHCMQIDFECVCKEFFFSKLTSLPFRRGVCLQNIKKEGSP